ncbi:hypothetical protein H2198_004855 [Neophaeococcomyces mojaviensis]|uniref:Uncharacterized protein n=1 Tax=Neophaeococcomyces mojaviensis TaxID=3383035 RepID=A0ACC3A7F9_9EURO|nr:hypothetical protein H2198_004855 [Knufia sp. JES_112]
MPRSPCEAQVDANAPALLDKSVAVNVYGWAMKDPLASKRPVFAIINCYEPDSRGIKAALTNKDNKAVVERQTLKLTDREQNSESEKGTRKFLVVGYAYPDMVTAEEYRSVGGAKPRAAVGVKGNSGKLVKNTDGKVPWLVVSQILPAVTEQFKYHVLFYPEDDLCQPFIITKELTFYFHEFRNHATSVQKRKEEWDDAVQLRSIRPGNLQELSKRQKSFRRAHDTTAIPFPKNVSLANEILCLELAFESSSDPHCLRAMSQAIMEVENDLQYARLPENRELHKLVEDDEEFELADAKVVLSEMSESTGSISPHDIIRLRNAMMSSGDVVEYRLARTWLKECLYQMKAKPRMSDEQLRTLSISYLGTARRMLPETIATPATSSDESHMTLRALRNKLQEICDACSRYNQHLLNMVGDKGKAATIDDAWAAYAGAPDIDSAKKAFYEVWYFVIRQLSTREEGAEAMLREVIKILDTAIPKA